MESIKALLDQNNTPQLIAVFLDTTVEHVIEEMKSMELYGWGRPENYSFIIARKLSFERRWHERFERILTQARELHDKGFLTMVQVRDSDVIVQYAFPVREPKPRDRLWFTAPPEIY